MNDQLTNDIQKETASVIPHLISVAINNEIGSRNNIISSIRSSEWSKGDSWVGQGRTGKRLSIFAPTEEGWFGEGCWTLTEFYRNIDSILLDVQP